MVGRSAQELDVLEGARQRELAMERLRGHPTIPQMEAWPRLPDRSSKLVLVAGQPIEVGDDACMLFTFADLEPRRRAEAAGRRSEGLFETAFRLAPVPMAVAEIDHRFCFRSVNEAFAKATGHGEKDAAGRTAEELGLWERPEEAPRLQKRLRKAGSARDVEVRLRAKDGSVLDCLFSAEAVTIHDRACALWTIQDISERRRGKEDLAAAIDAAMRETSWFSRTVLEKLANLRRPTGKPEAEASGVADLTRRGGEVLGLVCRGLDDGAIATRVAAPEGAPALPPSASWGAIASGVIIALTIGLMLNTLGAAVGASAVDAVGRDTPSAATFGIGAGIWLVVSNLIGLAAGGYVAARLSGTADDTDAILHGLGVWAVTFLVTAVLLGNLVGGAASAMSGAVSSLAGGASRGAGSAVSAVAGQANPQALIERARMALTGPSDPARTTAEQRGAEITGLIGRRIANGSLTGEERQRLNALVAAEAGIPQQEAAQRVQSYEAEAQRLATEAEQRARRAADAAASGAATTGFLAFAALLLGGVAAAFGARAGARNLLAVGGAGRNVRQGT